MPFSLPSVAGSNNCLFPGGTTGRPAPCCLIWSGVRARELVDLDDARRGAKATVMGRTAARSETEQAIFIVLRIDHTKMVCKRGFTSRNNNKDSNALKRILFVVMGDGEWRKVIHRKHLSSRHLRHRHQTSQIMGEGRNGSKNGRFRSLFVLVYLYIFMTWRW